MRSAPDGQTTTRITCGAPTAVIVEDDPAVLRLTVRTLDDLGVVCTPFYDAEAALRWMSANATPDLVVADVCLPSMSGFGFLKELRRHARFHATRLLVMTARAEVALAIDATRFGARFLTKPYRLHELRDAVTELLCLGPPKRRIVIVDDDEGIVEALTNVVRDEGFEPVIARDGAQAVRLLKANAPPELVLLDLMMPGLDGVAVAHLIRASPHVCETPIVLVSARDDVAREARRVGALHLRKPVDLDDIVALIRKTTGAAAHSAG